MDPTKPTTKTDNSKKNQPTKILKKMDPTKSTGKLDNSLKKEP